MLKTKHCIKPIKHLNYINNEDKYKQAHDEFIIRNPDYQKNC